MKDLLSNKSGLIPLNQRSKEECRAIQSAGGKAAGAKLREIKKIRDLINGVRLATGEDPLHEAIAQIFIDIKNPKISLDERVRAITFLRDTLGEKQSDKIEVSAFEHMSDAEINALIITEAKKLGDGEYET